METSPLSTIYHMVHVAEGLGTAGQPTTAQLAAIKDAGYEGHHQLGHGDDAP